MRESKVERYLRKAVIDRGGLFLKFTSEGWAGAPDRLLINREGITRYVEMKAPGKKLRALQQIRKEQLEERKCLVYKIDTMAKADALVIESFGLSAEAFG